MGHKAREVRGRGEHSRRRWDYMINVLRHTRERPERPITQGRGCQLPAHPGPGPGNAAGRREAGVQARGSPCSSPVSPKKATTREHHSSTFSH